MIISSGILRVSSELILTCARTDATEKKVDRLVRSGALVNCVTQHEGSPPLFFAANRGHGAIVRYLVNRGAEIDWVNKEGWTPLGGALIADCMDVANLLLGLGAKRVGAGIKTDGLNCALINSCGKGGSLQLLQLVVEAGGDIHYRGDSTPLHFAVKWSHLDIIEYLVAAGVYIDTLDSKGETALTAACRGGQMEYVRALLSLGADPYRASQEEFSEEIEKVLSARVGEIQAAQEVLNRKCMNTVTNMLRWL